jgi:hypothetical protein
MASLQGWELCDQPFRRGHIAAEDLVFAVDRGTDQSSRGTWPDVELLGYDGERIAHYLGDVVSTVPQLVSRKRKAPPYRSWPIDFGLHARKGFAMRTSVPERRDEGAKDFT